MHPGHSVDPILRAAVADVAATAVVFLFSVLLDNSSVYDPYWSVAPPVIAAYWIATATAGSVGVQKGVLLGLILGWAGRLTFNWARRWGGSDDEDFRYREIRAKTGRGYWPASFVAIHLMPTLWVFLGLLPVYPALSLPADLGHAGSLVALAGAIVTMAAIAIETVADQQLRQFLRSPHQPGEVLNRGLWARCRHPNYLGEILLWWGLFLFGVAAHPSWAWTIVGPLSITLLFVFISVPWMDRHMLARHSGWAEQMRRVPALIPWRSSKAGW